MTDAAPAPPTRARPAADAAAVFPGHSEMAERCRALDWAATPLGPVAGWPASLRTVVGLCLAAPGPMCLSWGPELVLVYNDAYRAVLGAAKDPWALGRPTREVWAEVWDQIAPDFAALVAGGPVAAHEDQRLVICRDGRDEEAFFSYALVPVRDEAGRVGGGLHVFTDTTGRVRAEAALRAERERLRSLILDTPAPLALLEGPEHRFALVNDAYKRVSGGGRDVTGLTPPEAFPELAGSGIYELFDRVYATGEPWDGPETLCRYDRDGTGVIDTWCNLRFEPVRDAGGRVVAILNFAVDVTEQVRARREIERLLAEAEAARAEAERRAGVLAAVIQSMPDAVYVGSIAGVTVANRAALDLLGYDTLPELNRGIPTLAEEIRTRDPSTGRRLAPEEEAFVRALRGEERVTREVLIRHRRTGGDRLVHAVAMPVRGPGGAVVAAVTVSRDVTEARAAAAERERLLAEAEAARAAAEAADQAKGQFLATMSHELRTPLNAIGGYAQLLDMGLHGPVTDAQRGARARVQAAQTRLLALVNDVLNYAKLGSGRVEYDVRAVDLADVIRDVAPLVEPQLRAKGLAFDVRLPAAPCLVWADREKLGQVLVNLPSNAIKFTDSPHPTTGAPGRVTVSVATRADGDADHDAAAAAGTTAFLQVRDTGREIPRDKQDSIFEPFVQVRTSGSAYAHATEGPAWGSPSAATWRAAWAGTCACAAPRARARRSRSRCGGRPLPAAPRRRAAGTETWRNGRFRPSERWVLGTRRATCLAPRGLTISGRGGRASCGRRGPVNARAASHAIAASPALPSG